MRLSLCYFKAERSSLRWCRTELYLLSALCLAAWSCWNADSISATIACAFFISSAAFAPELAS